MPKVSKRNHAVRTASITSPIKATSASASSRTRTRTSASGSGSGSAATAAAAAPASKSSKGAKGSKGSATKTQKQPRTAAAARAAARSSTAAALSATAPATPPRPDADAMDVSPHPTPKPAPGAPLLKKKAATLPKLKDSDLPLPTRPERTGNVLIMGNGDCGQLGLGDDIKSRFKYSFVKSLKDLPIVSLAAGGLHTLALAADGKVYSWGCNDEGALGRDVPDGQECDVAPIPGSEALNLVKLACGDSVSLGLSADGQIFGWGTFKGTETSNLGFTSDVRNARVPTLLAGPVFSRYRFVDVAAGNNHALALSSDGKVYAWGNVEQGQCGFKTHRPISALNPRGLKFGRGVKITAIACGGDHSLAIDADGDVWAFGLNNFGQCGKHPSVLKVETPMMTPMPADKKAVAAAGGDHYSVVVLEDGSVATFGKAADAQLGLGDTINMDAAGDLTTERFFATVIAPTGAEARQEVPPHVYRPAQVPALGGITKVSAGANHVFVLDKDHVAWRWGFNEMGQLGMGASANDEDATEDVRAPAAMDMSKSKSEVLDVACGAQHSVILVYTPPKDE